MECDWHWSRADLLWWLVARCLARGDTTRAMSLWAVLESHVDDLQVHADLYGPH